MKHILVTGGAGFLGSHLCHKLIEMGHHVTCMDNFYTGNKRNIEVLLDHPYFNFLRHDITSPLPETIVVDEIYNLACPASPVHYQKDPVQTIKTSVHGSINVLELAKQLGAKVFQTSTSEVYGDPKVHPQTEEYWGNVNPLGIRSCYDEGKRCAESLYFSYYKQYKVSIKIVRIFNTFGPNMHPNDGRVISNFIMQALQNKDITLYGHGKQTRSFCYVDDLIDAFLTFMALPHDITGPLNLGNPLETPIEKLAELIIELTNSSSNIVYNTLPQDDPKQRCPDISKARTLLNWEPTTTLQTGLMRTIEDLQKYLIQQ